MSREIVKVNLKQYMNSKGITSEDNMAEATLTIGSSSIPQKTIEEAEGLFAGIPFRVQSESRFDNIFADNQRIAIGSNAKSIYILGVSCQGDYQEEINVFYDDDQYETYLCGFSDFLSIEPYFNDILGRRFEYSHTANGINENLKISLWVNKIDVTSSKRIKELILPKNIFLHIFAITVFK